MLRQNNTKKILITGFEPFGGDALNASWEAVCALPECVDGATVIKAQLPVEFGKVKACLANLIAKHNPDAIICTGQAEGRTMITPEKIAVNWMASSAVDNAGFKSEGSRIEADGADGIFATLPVEEITKKLMAAGIPAQVSYTAGTYVCNCTMYHLLYQLEAEQKHIPAGFIHVPCSTAQVCGRTGTSHIPPSMTPEMIREGLEIAVQVVAESL